MLDITAHEQAVLLVELIRRYSRKSRFVGKAFHTDINPTESHLLIELDAHPGKNIGDLCTALGLDRSTLSRSLDNLVKRGLLRAEKIAEDRRQKKFTFSKKGRELLAALDNSANAHVQPFVNNLTAEELARMRMLLKIFLDRDNAPPVTHRPHELPVLVEMRRVSRSWGLIGRSFMGSKCSAATWQLLMEIRRCKGGCSPGFLAEQFQLAQTTISLNVKRLEEAGLVSRERAEQDARRVKVHLTAQGLSFLQEIEALAVQRLVPALKPLSVEDRSALFSLLAKYSAEQLEGYRLVEPENEIQELKSEDERRLARVFLIEQLVREQLHHFLPAVIFSGDSLCFSCSKQGKVVAVAEISAAEGEGRLIQYAVDSEALSQDQDRAFLEQVWAKSLTHKIEKLIVPHGSRASWQVKSIGGVEEDQALVLSAAGR